jgi:hypothetical protein
VKFCTVCGTPVGSTPAPSPIPTPVQEPEDEATVVLDEEPIAEDEATVVLDEEPTPEPVPEPTPAPIPVPEPTPAPIPEPVPEPTPAPIPEPTPEPAPEPAVQEPEDEATMILEEEPADEATMILEEEPADEATTILGEQPAYQQPVYQQPQNQQPTYQQPTYQQPQSTYQQPAYQQPQNQTPTQPLNQAPNQAPVNASKPEKKKGGNGVVIAIAVIAVLAVIGVAVGIMIKKEIIKLPGSLGTESTEVADEDSSEVTSENATGENQETVAADVDVESLVADIDASVEDAKSMLDDDTQVLDGMDKLRTAMDDYLAKSEEAGGYSEVIDEKINAAYSDYVDGVKKRLNFLSQQTLAGSIYTQAMDEVNNVLDYADTLNAAGYNVDELVASLNSTKEQFDTDYRNNMIETFNEFSTREQWSRTEAWNLMSTADQMYDENDMEDPIRLRFEYALAYFYQKEAETQYNDGTITAKGAAQKIAGVIPDTDYNLMLIYEYMLYMEEAGEDYSEVSDAYYDALYQIYDTQGIDLTSDIDIYKFWSFNSFDEYSSSVEDGDINGLSNDNRTYIRELFQGISFVD